MQKSVEKRCSYCFSLIARGKSHKCNLSARLNNINSYIAEANSKFRDQIISSLVKQKENNGVDSTSSSTSTIMSLVQPRGGRPLNILVKPRTTSTRSKQLLSADDFLKIQTNLNLSQKTTCQIAAAIRVATRNRKSIESNLKKKLSTVAHSVDKYFTAREVQFESIKGNISTNSDEILVYCKDLDGFIQHVKDERGVSECHLKLGIDGGGGFLKICLSLQSTDEVISTNYRSKYCDGIAAKRFKDSGVKKIFIIGLVQSLQENYENVTKLWSALNLNNFSGTIATDLKLANILAGIMSHSSLYPCTWCYAVKDKLDETGPVRTIKNVTDNYLNWSHAGSIKANAKKFKNCIHLPVIKGNDKTFLEVIPPPELHLMLGVVNTLYANMLKDGFGKDATDWAKSCNVEREVTHGGTGFKGNSCKILLNKIDILRSGCSLGCLKYVKVFENFRDVVNACFGKTLDEKFKMKIAAFKESFLALDIRVTPKVHAVFFHVSEFCEPKLKGLGFFSEQATEAVHFDFNRVWSKYKVPSGNSEYLNKLLHAICEYNGLHV